MKKKSSLRSNSGFTIVELMIALSVLATILVISSLVMIQIGKWYTKGVNQANLQSVNRTVVADITNELEFTCSASQSCVLGTPQSFHNSQDQTNVIVGSFCAYKTRYSYVTGIEQGTDQFANPNPTTLPHVLWRDTMANNSICPPLDLTTVGKPNNSGADGYDMLGDHMRLVRFNVAEAPPNSGVYNVDVAMAFGDSDLLNSTFSSCSGTTGSEFCSISHISSTVSRRVE